MEVIERRGNHVYIGALAGENVEPAVHRVRRVRLGFKTLIEIVHRFVAETPGGSVGIVQKTASILIA